MERPAGPTIGRRRLIAGAALALAGTARARAQGREASMGSTGRMPVAFVGHGSPMLALDAQKGADLARWAASLPRTPSAIVVVSAHWQAAPPTLGSLRAGTPLLYDFGGFPDALYRVRHDAPPVPEPLARQIEAALSPLGARRSERGLDHGAWVPLRHFDPEARVPTLQISMPHTLGARELFSLGRALAPLRDEGVWIQGSGNATHNLGRLAPDDGTPPPAWAVEFDDWLAGALTAGDVDALLDAPSRAPAFSLAHPTDEHFRPLLVAVGAAEAELGRVAFPVTGFEHGSLSRRSVAIG